MTWRLATSPIRTMREFKLGQGTDAVQSLDLCENKRMQAFYHGVGAVFLHGSEGWILTQTMAKEMRAWNYKNM